MGRQRRASRAARRTRPRPRATVCGRGGGESHGARVPAPAKCWRKLSPVPRLLFDLTPLDTPSGPRGIGRYIRELALGLARLPSEELGGIEILGLTSLTWSGAYQVTDDIASYRGGARSVAPTEADFYQWAWRQRLALWRAAKSLNAGAVHVTDPHATPLFFGLPGCRTSVTSFDLVPTN